MNSNLILLHVWGERACFTRPEFAAERVSYEAMTPSAAKGVLDAIHWKPGFQWSVDRIHVLRPVRYETERHSELKVTGRIVNNAAGIANSTAHIDARTLRQTMLLRDVAYAIEAHVELMPIRGSERNWDPLRRITKHLKMFRRRARLGQCVYQPSLGLRDYVADFELVDAPPPSTLPADQRDRDLGWMLADIGYAPGGKVNPRYFYATLRRGVIDVHASPPARTDRGNGPLEALVRLYDRFQADGENVPPFGYGAEKVAYCIVIDHTGTVIGVRSLMQQSAKNPMKQWKSDLIVPKPLRARTSNVNPYFLCENVKYAFGVDDDMHRAAKCHDAFADLHISLLSHSADRGMKAVVAFVRQSSPVVFDSLSRFVDTDVLHRHNIMVFALDSEEGYNHDRPEATRIWDAHVNRASSGAYEDQCLVTGERAVIERTHPVIVGVPNWLRSGEVLVSFQIGTPWMFHGRSQGYNACVSRKLAHKYASALRHMIGARQSVQIATSNNMFVLTYWAEGAHPNAAEEVYRLLINPRDDELEAFCRLLDRLRAGGSIGGGIDDARLYLLGLASASGRLMVMLWHYDTLISVARNVARYYDDLAMVDPTWETALIRQRQGEEAQSLAPAFWRVLGAIAPPGDAGLPLRFGPDITRAIVTGGRLPVTAYAAALGRFRADPHTGMASMERLQAGLCKAYLVRSSTKEIAVMLDRAVVDIGYLLGRLFALYENAQGKAASGKGARRIVRTRYMNAALTSPLVVTFRKLFQMCPRWLHAARKQRKAVSWIEAELGEIHAMMGGDGQYPERLTVEQQGRLVIGKIRNYIQLEGDSLFIEPRQPLNRKIADACDAVGQPSYAKKGGGYDTGAAKQRAQNDVAVVQDELCRRYFDVRAFGGVLSTGPNAGVLTGPVQITDATSIDPIEPEDMTITRVADVDKEEGEMGSKHVVPYALYRARGHVSAFLAQRTGFSDDDLLRLWSALDNMFDHDRSTARGEMAARRLIVFAHDLPIGNAPARTLLDRVNVRRSANGPAREWADYDVTVDVTGLPSGVTMDEVI